MLLISTGVSFYISIPNYKRDRNIFYIFLNLCPNNKVDV